MTKINNSKAVPAININSKKDLIASLYTDRERLLPLVNTKERILSETKEKLEDFCNTSHITNKIEKD